MNKIIPIFIPHAGCPHDCIFCNQKKISGSVKTPTSMEIDKLITDYLEHGKIQGNNFLVAFYGGSFTAVDRNLQIEMLEIANKYLEDKKISGIRVSTRPDYLKEDDVKLLKKYNVTHVEIGIQSTDKTVLENTKRYYDLDTVKAGVRNLTEQGIEYGFQIMTGLPLDTPKRLARTCFDLIPLKPSTIRIYPVLVIKDTELEEMYLNKEYEPLGLEDSLELTVMPYMIFDFNRIKIIRVGLHSSESLTEGDAIVAGPFHPAYGEMTVSHIYLGMITDFVKNSEVSVKQLTIASNSRIRSKLTGVKRFVLRKLKENHDLEIKFKEDNSLTDGIIIIGPDGHETPLELRDYYEKKIKEFRLLL
ncbi:MAG: radical SAM protein [Eubacteriaceae bacterium]|nr:radical SAM protein [Eubacteriaceae bacterium]